MVENNQNFVFEAQREVGTNMKALKDMNSFERSRVGIERRPLIFFNAPHETYLLDSESTILRTLHCT